MLIHLIVIPILYSTSKPLFSNNWPPHPGDTPRSPHPVDTPRPPHPGDTPSSPYSVDTPR